MPFETLYIQLLRGVMIGLLTLWAAIFFSGHHLFGQPTRRKQRLADEFRPSILRPWMGVLMVFLILGYIVGFTIDLLPPEQQQWKLEMSFLFDVLVVPLCVVITAKILRLDYMRWLRIALNFMPFLLLVVLRFLINSQVILYVCLAYILLYLAVAAGLMIHYGRRYEAQLQNQYSSLYGRSIRWMTIIPVLASLQIAAFLVKAGFHDIVWHQVAYYLLSMVNLSVIFTFVYRMILTEEDSSPADAVVDLPQEMPVSEETNSDERNREFLALLQTRCVDTLLYTREDLTRDELARVLGMSHSTLTQRLRSALNLSFYEYINGLRIEHAAALLSEGKMSAKQVAFEVGYQYYSTFARAFQAHFGCSPSEYKQ